MTMQNTAVPEMRGGKQRRMYLFINEFYLIQYLFESVPSAAQYMQTRGGLKRLTRARQSGISELSRKRSENENGSICAAPGTQAVSGSKAFKHRPGVYTRNDLLLRKACR